MLIKGNNGKAPARRKSASSSSKSSRSNSVQKSRAGSNNGKAANKLDGDIDRTESAAVESEAGDRVLEIAGISEAAPRNDLPSESVELTAITLHQPWASLIAAGYKQYETRDWPTTYRGLIAIHAGRKPKGKQELREHDKVVASFSDLLTEECSYSSIIAIAELADVICMTEEFINQQSATELRCGDWKVGRYAFKLENIWAIEPIEAAGKQGLWKWSSDSWNPADFGELHHKAEPDGQLNLLEWKDTEPPDPDDYQSPTEFAFAFDQWKENQAKKIDTPVFTAKERYELETGNDASELGEKECSTLMDGSTFVQESVQGSPLQESNCGSDRPTTLSSGTATANQFSQKDTQTPKDTAISTQLTSEQTSQNLQNQSNLLLAAPLASPFQLTETDVLPGIIETVSPAYSGQSENCSPSSQLLKMSSDSSTVLTPPATNPEVTLDSSSTPYRQTGTMRNGFVSGATNSPLRGVGKDYLLLRSPGALSTTTGRPPGKTRLESQLNQLGLIQDGEVAAPEFLEAGYNLPIQYTNLQENRTALELSQVQAQQSSIDQIQTQQSIDPKLELQVETETTAIVEKPSATPLTGALLLSDCAELNISVELPPNIGALTKIELLSMAREQHQLICFIERKEFELALEKLHRVHLTGVYLQEFKKRCQYGEFENQLEQVGISIRSAQNYMVIAKNWEIVETETKRVSFLQEENQHTFSLRWALETVRNQKKQLKSAAPPKDPDNYRTPNTSEQPIVSLVKKALGGQIWLDPCSDEGGNIPAAVRYYKHDDGLAVHNTWSKTVFINPPFSDPFPWVERCCLEIARGSISAAIMLLKAGTVSNVGTGEWIKKYASALCHWKGRIHFLNDQGNPVKGSDFDCVFVYFGARLDLFRDSFGGRGTIATIENHYSSVNKKYLLKNEIADFGNTQAEQKQLAAAVGLGNGRSVLPDMRDRDRELAERYDPHTVVDVLSVPTMSPTVPAPPVSENLAHPLGEPEVFDETPLATRQFETAKANTLNDYITAISSNIAEFDGEQLAFLYATVAGEMKKRNMKMMMDFER